MNRFLWLILSILALTLTFCKNKNTAGLEEFDQDEIEQTYDGFSGIMDTVDLAYLKLECNYKICTEDELLAFYDKLENRPAWFDKTGLTENYTSLREAIEESRSHGLNPEHYKVYFPDFLDNDSSESMFENGTMELVKADIALSWAYLTLAQHLNSGKTKPQETKTYWLSAPMMTSISEVCAEGIEKKDVKETLAALAPAREGYDELREQHGKYMQLAESGGWAKIPKSDSTLEVGMRSPSVPFVRHRLAMTGELASASASDSLLFDEQVKMAVVNYQDRNGLHEDARLGPNTLASMNLSAQDRVKQIEINLERMRWLGKQSQDPYLTINIPEYVLRYFDKGEEEFNMKVIVGRDLNRTPIFADTMEYLVFSPTWTVPMSISRDELLPKLKKDPYSLREDNFIIYESFDKDAAEVNPNRVDWAKMDSSSFNYRVVQQPGVKNALGRVKFIFPNDEDIYLHDTPAGYLFERTERNFSHGCIRVEKPEFLASFLTDKEFDENEIKEMMTLPEPKTVMLKHKLPVMLTYQTAFVKDGKMNFRPDIYGYDEVQYEELEQQQTAML